MEEEAEEGEEEEGEEVMEVGCGIDFCTYFGINTFTSKVLSVQNSIVWYSLC